MTVVGLNRDLARVGMSLNRLNSFNGRKQLYFGVKQVLLKKRGFESKDGLVNKNIKTKF